MSARRKRERRAENERTRAEGAQAFRDGKSRESNPHHYCNKDQWWRGYDWEQALFEQREDELATRAVEEQMLAQREADFKAGFSFAWSMAGYGDYDANEASSWKEHIDG